MFPKAELRTTRAAVALLARLRHSARLRSPARHFGGPELRGGKAVGRRLYEQQPRHAGSCSRGRENSLGTRRLVGLTAIRRLRRGQGHAGSCSPLETDSAGGSRRTCSPGGAVV